MLLAVNRRVSMKKINEVTLKSVLQTLRFITDDEIDKVVATLKNKNQTLQPLFLSQREVAEICRVNRQTVYNWVKGNTLKPVEIQGVKRYRYEDVKRLGVSDVTEG
jgi:predicted DNA-binding transcriptional regulator AlpA